MDDLQVLYAYADLVRKYVDRRPRIRRPPAGGVEFQVFNGRRHVRVLTPVPECRRVIEELSCPA